MKLENPNLPMGIKEFVPGEIYYTTTPGEYIFRYVDKTCYYDNGYIVSPYSSEAPSFGSGRGSGHSPWFFDKLRVATEIEKAWFHACYKAQTFISFDAIPPLFKDEKIKVSYTTIDGKMETTIIDGPLENASKLKDFKSINYHIVL